MPDRGALEVRGVVRRQEHVSRSVPFVTDVSLVLEQAEHASDGRIARLVREVGEDIGRGGALAADEDVHDLSLATAELGQRFGHNIWYSASGAASCTYTSTEEASGQQSLAEHGGGIAGKHQLPVRGDRRDPLGHETLVKVAEVELRPELASIVIAQLEDAHLPEEVAAVRRIVRPALRFASRGGCGDV